MTAPALEDATVEELRGRVRGAVYEHGDDGYDEARSVWNARIDHRPAVVVSARGVADVVEGVAFADDHDVLLGVKSGGHHVSGCAVPDGGLLLDLAEMNGVRVDPDAKTARVGAGATWGEVDHETQAFGLAVTGGQDPNIGVAGLTLGGGVGWLSRKYGLTCDNLLSADVVTADGELVHASAETNPDLFWALRGGGGNFGIVTAFEFQLHEVGPEVFAGSLVYPLDEAGHVARRYREFVADAPREVRLLFGIMELPAASYYPDVVHETRVAMVIACYAGPPEEGERVLAPLRTFGDPLMDSLRARSYRAFQRAGESRGSVRTSVKSQYLSTLTDQAIDTVVEYAADVPSPGATVFVSHRGGAETDPEPDATAYPHREEAHHLLVEARWTDPQRDDEHVAWTRTFHRVVEPYTTGDVSMNFLSDDAGEDRVSAAYGGNYERLASIKAEWDPENRFRTNQNVRPTVDGQGVQNDHAD